VSKFCLDIRPIWSIQRFYIHVFSNTAIFEGVETNISSWIRIMQWPFLSVSYERNIPAKVGIHWYFVLYIHTLIQPSWIYNYLCNLCLSLFMFEFDSRSWRGVFDTTLSDKVCQWLRPICGFLLVLRFPPRYNWNIVEWR
jgi:hypothetical protein